MKRMLRMLFEYFNLLRAPFPFRYYGLKKRIIVHLKDLYYASKGVLTSRKKGSEKTENQKTPRGIWGKLEQGMSFMLRYYAPEDYIYGPIIGATATAVHQDSIPYYDDIKDLASQSSIAEVAAGLHALHPKIAEDRWSKWLSCYAGYLGGGALENRGLLARIKENDILEIGPGIGAVMLYLGELIGNEHQVISYDLEQMQVVQKSLHRRYAQLVGRHLHLSYFDTLPSLKQFLLDKDYVILSFYAFNEMPIDIRHKFEELINNSVFSLFVANLNFDGIDNNKYFEELGSRVENKTYASFPVKLKNMRNFQSKHRIHLYT